MADMDDNGITTRSIELQLLSGSSAVHSQVASTDDSSVRGKTVIEDSPARDIEARDEIVTIEDPSAPLIDEVSTQRQTSQATKSGSDVCDEQDGRRSSAVQGQVVSTDDSSVLCEIIIDDTSARDIEARDEIVTIEDRPVPGINEPLMAQRQPLQRTTYGCMVCKMVTELKTFNDNALERGDHIEIMGRLPCYNHHAIVSDVSNITTDGKYACVRVLDVSEKKAKEGCFRKNIIADNHKLNEMEQVECSRLVRLDYRKRRHGKESTFARAENSLFSEKYCCLIRNCEHFATACVGGKETVDDQGINNSISLQSISCIFSVVNVVMQCLFLIFLDLYFNFVHLCEDENWLSKKCYDGNLDYDTTCEWVAVCICVVVMIVVFVILFVILYFTLYKKNYMCKECLLSTGCVYVFRVVLFFLFNIINILGKVFNKDRNLGVITIIVVVEGFCIYVLSYCLTKLLIYCFGKSCCCCSSFCGVKIEADLCEYRMFYT